MMTELLQQAFNAVSSLPDEEQDRLAGWLLEEVSSEGRWRRLFENSQETLESLANEALAEMRNGTATPLDPESL